MRETAKKVEASFVIDTLFYLQKGRQMLYLGGARREFIEAKAVH